MYDMKVYLSLSLTHTHTIQFRAYGAVYKAMHKESGQLLAIKQVPVDSDLQDIIKEISIMQQCDRFVRNTPIHTHTHTHTTYIQHTHIGMC